MRIGYERTSKKKIQWKFCFPMRRRSTLMKFITLKMIEYGRLIVQLPIPKVVSGKNESFRKRLWFGSEFVPEMYLLWCSSRIGQWTAIDTSKRCFQLPTSLVTTCLEPIGLSSKTVQRHTFMQNQKNDVLSTSLVSSTRIIDPQTVLIWIRIWDELAHQIN